MAAVAYDEATALVVVDVQNDFAHPDGSLSVEGAEAVLPAVNEEIAAARAAGAPVVYTRTGTRRAPPISSPTAGLARALRGRDMGRGLPRGPRRRRSVGAQGHGGEDGYPGSACATRRRTTSTRPASTRSSTDRDVSRVVIVGLALDYCVRETASTRAPRIPARRGAEGDHGRGRGRARRRCPGRGDDGRRRGHARLTGSPVRPSGRASGGCDRRDGGGGEVGGVGDGGDVVVEQDVDARCAATRRRSTSRRRWPDDGRQRAATAA